MTDANIENVITLSDKLFSQLIRGEKNNDKNK